MNDVAEVVADPWGLQSPWEIDREKREAAEKAAEAAREEERRKAAWVNMTTRPNEWLQIVLCRNASNGALRVAVALAGYGGNGNTQGVFPTYKTLMEKTSKSRAVVSAGIKDLREADLIRERHRSYDGPVVYDLGAMPEED
ncbi:hypothetical protein E0500_038505 [Streptomyces sp. KM273126]|uniref:helix-turn-helix domain-containing protein n=1 Tax=Streptomyces sp. KM273126 TaxID=2545247 RepID=UPI00103C2834|nr:helix-turn-helix domain-containing protein [Streptomyces sp. KM273126]MBA2813051.1 hypothetical protein [Streptomyces sp. KM273126]